MSAHADTPPSAGIDWRRLLPENPFFRREVRAGARRAFFPHSGFLFAGAALPLLLLCALEWLRWRYGWDARWGRTMALGALALLCGALFAATGAELGSRVLMEEQRRQTLETLRLVSMTPWLWVPAKLVFPLFGMALVGAATLPGILIVMLRGFFLPRDWEPGILLAGAAGLLGLGTLLLLPPEGLTSPSRRSRHLSVPERIGELAHLAVPLWLTMVLFNMGWDWLRAVGEAGTLGFTLPPMPDRPFFAGWLNRLTALQLHLGLFLLAALASTWHQANPAAPRARGLDLTLRGVLVLATYLLFVGYSWPGADPRYRGVLIGLPLLVLGGMAFRNWRAARRRRRWEDRWAEREIAWLQRLTDNPVFLRDLRVGWRATGWRKQALLLLLFLVGGNALLCGWVVQTFGAAFAAGRESFPWMVAAVMASVLMVIGAVLSPAMLLVIGAQASQQWNLERKYETIPQLLGTPLTSREILLGRWSAALVAGALRALVFPLCFLTGLAVLTRFNGFDWVLPLGLWIFTLGIFLSVAFAVSFERPGGIGGLWAPAALVAYGVVAELMGLLMVLIGGATTGTLQGVYLLFCAIAGVMNLACSWWMFQYGEHRLNVLRDRLFG